MKCDIIIPVWNQLDFTRECVDSIFRNTRYPYRLILVDNASDGQTKRYLEGIYSKAPVEVKLIRNETNTGFIKAVNQGLKESRSPYVCVLNNDTIVSPGWLGNMVRFADTHKDAGLINPLCDGHGDIPIEEYARSLEKNNGIYMEMNQCQGYAMLVKREVIDKIGYLDESFGIGGFDDTDYSMRAHKAGYRSVAIYDSYVYHRLHGSFDKAGNREEWVRRNEKLYYDKWGKHIRVGISARLNKNDLGPVSDLMKFAYGLAREWAWVHIWINSTESPVSVKSTIDDAIKKNGYPLHQNIRIQYFNLPDFIFNLLACGKYAERALNPRMRNKRFDAVFDIGDKRIRGYFLKASGWEDAGKKMALELIQTRKR